jgi:hypothetical protein
MDSSDDLINEARKLKIEIENLIKEDDQIMHILQVKRKRLNQIYELLEIKGIILNE